jgi:hypothetical protein
MKNIIIILLAEALTKVEAQTPKTKKVERNISINDVNPIDIPAFMIKNNIPDDAYISGVDNGYDGWHVGQLNLCWEVDVPLNDNDILQYKRIRFTSVAFKLMYDYLINNGYKRVGFNTARLREFKDTTVYDMYMNQEYDKLVDYYSLSFKPITDLN